MAIPELKIEELSFSLYTRYKSIAESIELLREGSESLTILEVGGRGNYLRYFVPKDKVTILDVIDSDEDNYVKGDGRSLPFKPGEFDLVVSTDVLEHIPSRDRKSFIKENLRVAKRAMILAGPMESEFIVEVEKEANNYFKDNYGQEHPWLTEHIEYGLPKSNEVEAIFDKQKLPWIVRYNQQLDLWRELILIDMAIALFGTSKVMSALKQLNKIYNKLIFPYDQGPSGYRSIYIVSVNGRQLPTTNQQNTFNNLPAKDLLKLMLAITNILRLIEKHYSTLLIHAKKRGEAVEELSDEVKRLGSQNREIAKYHEDLKARVKRIESSRAYKLWSAYRRIIGR